MANEMELLARIENLEREVQELKQAPIHTARCFRVVDADGALMAQLADDTQGGVTFYMGKTGDHPPILLHAPSSGRPFIGIRAPNGNYTAGIFIRSGGQPSLQLREQDGTVRVSIGIDEDGRTSLVLGDRTQMRGLIAEVDADGSASIREFRKDGDSTQDATIPVVQGSPDFDSEEVPFPFTFGPRLLASTVSPDDLRRRAASGEAEALHDLALDTWDDAHGAGGVFPDGDILRESVGLFRKAADHKLPEAMFALGVVECTVVGMKNIRDALEWFKDADAAGHSEAKKAIRWLQENYREYVDVVRK